MATRPTHGEADTEQPSHLTEEVAAPAPVLAPRATPEEMAASAIGAQVILDYNSAGSLGARGGAGATMEENTAARDAHLVALGLDPTNPSGPPTAPDPAGAVLATETAGAPVGRATRVSSLAAGIITGARAPLPAKPANVDVPAVTQAGDTLTCTTGNWTGEPTIYSYAWTVDGAMVGTSAATHTVTAADAGKVAVCTVSATNAAGTTAAPPSADLVITDPGVAGTASRSRNK